MQAASGAHVLPNPFKRAGYYALYLANLYFELLQRSCVTSRELATARTFGEINPAARRIIHRIRILCAYVNYHGTIVSRERRTNISARNNANYPRVNTGEPETGRLKRVGTMREY